MFGLQFLIQRGRICLERMLRDIQHFHLQCADDFITCLWSSMLPIFHLIPKRFSRPIFTDTGRDRDARCIACIIRHRAALDQAGYLQILV